MPVPNQAQTRRRESISEKLSNRTYSASVEVKDPWVYHDTHVLDASTSPTVLFNNSSSKALSLSNYQYQQLPQGQSFDVHALKVSYYSHAIMVDATQQLLLTWWNKSMLQVIINNKVPSFERNIGSLLGGAVQAVIAPAATYASRNMSSWVGNTIVHFKRKISLDQNTQWTIKILKDAANDASLTGDYLRVEMIGTLTCQL